MSKVKKAFLKNFCLKIKMLEILKFIIAHQHNLKQYRERLHYVHLLDYKVHTATDMSL